MKNKINAEIMRSHSSFFILHSSFFIYKELYSELLPYILRNSILVYHEVHGVVGNVALGHIPDALVVASLAP